jgi:predicted regulator of Ras-like GTPase activity (Roadblock/LC7/MglB family)
MTEPKAALDELTEISSQIQAAALFDDTGKVIASTLPDDRATRFAASARALFEEAQRAGEGDPMQVEAATAAGSLFVVRDGKTLIAASTSPSPTAGLVFYDLKSCLRSAAAPKPKPKPRAKPKPKAETNPKPKAETKPKPKPRPRGDAKS